VTFDSKLSLETAMREGPGDPNNIEDFELMNDVDDHTRLYYLAYAYETKRVKKTKPLRETEILDFCMTIREIDLATFRDVQRRRYFTININRWNNYQSSSNQEFELLSSPLSTTLDITIKGNLRQWTCAIEFRTQEQGQPNYSRIFQSCGIILAKQLGHDKEDLFPYADRLADEHIGLGRLKSEYKSERGRINNDSTIYSYSIQI
jgi:hypothetical protein